VFKVYSKFQCELYAFNIERKWNVYGPEERKISEKHNSVLMIYSGREKEKPLTTTGQGF
jgi:hypothetical protein